MDLLATAPGGVAKLRELILTLAVQGKLVPQDPADEPASVLLQKIRAEKDRLIAEGKIKRDKPLAEIAEEEKPFDLPVGWEWVRLDRLSTIGLTDGDWIETKDQDPEGAVRLVQLADIGDGFFKDKSERFISIETCERLNCTLLKRSDVLIARLPNPVGRACVFPGLDKAAITAVDIAICRIEGDLLPEFVSLAINAPSMRALIESYGKGATRFRVSTGHLKTLPLAIPPYAEQSRIVTRVEALMRLCDALEAQGQLEAAQHAQLVSTLLGTLTASTTPEELAANWQRVAQHFDVLLDRPEAIDALEQTLLQLAVRGLLVPQDPTDEPASALLQKIRAEKDRLIATGQIKRDKPLPPITDEEKPFELPVGWEWARFPDLCAIAGGATPSKANPNFWIGDIPWVSPKDMKVSQIRDAQDRISGSAIRGSLSLVPPGSLLMVVRGMILAHSFPIAETLVPVTINQDMKAATPYLPDVLPFLLLVTAGMKPEILALVERSTHGTCKLESPKIFGMLFPFPPLAEQSRIVTRVTALRRLCADLRQRLAERQSVQARLAEALVQEVA
ncbi:MAG: restriction endonuclease subunit S [Diaphorobacter nitroreducens]|uniref:restriction endonuclease subunit S n=1 Tax=Diaphorobacter nitroreducens TaxID=164759 RepID=UPI003C712B0B